MLDFIDFIFRLLGLDRTVTAGHAGGISQIFAQIERQLSIPYIGYYYLLIVVGLVLCLWGRQLYWLTVFFYGALIGAVVGFILGVAGGAAMFALIGGVLAIILQHVFNFVLGGLIGGILLVIAAPSPISFLLGFVLGGIVAVNIFRYLIIILSAMKGATLVGSSVKALMEPVPSMQPLRDIRDIFADAQYFLSTGKFPAASGSSGVLGMQPSSWGLILTVMCFVGGVWYQLRTSSRKAQGSFAQGFATDIDDIVDTDFSEELQAPGEDAPRPSVPAQALLEEAPAIIKSIPDLTTRTSETIKDDAMGNSPWQRTKVPSTERMPRVETKRVMGLAPQIRPPPAALDDARPEAPVLSDPVLAKSKVVQKKTDGKQEGTGVVIATAAVVGLTILAVLVLQKQKSQPPVAVKQRNGVQGSEALRSGASRSWPAGLEEATSLPIPEGRCALIIASRRSVADARLVMQEYAAQEYGAIYLAQNGWYAVSAGVFREGEAAGLITSLKRRGRIPEDSLCSAGRSYQSRVWP